jgi:hypothetical protein
MALAYVEGDVLMAPAQGLVIPVNCQGVAGCGLALAAKQACPRWFALYRAACESGELRIGRPVLHLFGGARWVLSFPTKETFRQRCSRLADIEAGLQTLVACSGPWRVPGVVMAVPKLGCGAGRLSWEVVRPVMEWYLSELVCSVLIYV